MWFNQLLDRVGLKAATVGRVLFDFLVVFAVLPLITWTSTATGGSGFESSNDPAPAMTSIVFGFVLGSISVNVFMLRGFYRQNRIFRPKRKVRAVAQGVLIAHGLFVVVPLAVRPMVTVSAGLIVVNLILNVLLLSMARIFSTNVAPVRQLLDAMDAPVTTTPDDRAKRVLVIGGGGYIGCGLLKRLLEGGYQVRLLDLLMFGEDPIRAYLDHPNLEIIRGDFRHADCVVRAARDVDTVVHLGAIVGDPACEIDQQLTLDTNLLATKMVAEVAKAAGVRRFVFASTCSVYGAGDELLTEESDLNPVSLYAKTKIACEEVLTDLQDEQMAVVILRFGTIYGLSGRTRFDLVVNLLTAKALVDGEITVFGGDQWRPFLHVDDASAAVMAAVESRPECLEPQVFNVGSDEQNMTIGDIGELVNRMVPSAELLNLGQDGDRRDYRVSFSRIRTHLGFKPEWTLQMGIQQVIDAIGSGAVTDYTEPRYSNVKTLNLDTVDRSAARSHAVNGNHQLGYRVTGGHGPWTEELMYDAAPTTAPEILDRQQVLNQK